MKDKTSETIEKEIENGTHVLCPCICGCETLISKDSASYGYGLCSTCYIRDIRGDDRHGKIPQRYLDRIAELTAELQTYKDGLSTSANVHTNILRGTIPLDRAAALHIAGAADYDSVKAELDALKNDWISVSGRLPEEGGIYWVTIQKRHRKIVIAARFYPKEKNMMPQFFKSKGIGVDVSSLVTAWKHLPEPFTPSEGK